ncbi:hypothetical protein EDB85DRAFT_2163433 [Lactarius pseudohatsudake]|nr:hypothetical protein EDB85DRAFT_2163433 [Lactarius pseudohatsudake]
MSSKTRWRRASRRATVVRSRSGLRWRLLDVAAPGCSRAATAAHGTAGLVNAISSLKRHREGVYAAREPAQIWLARCHRYMRGAASTDSAVIVVDSRHLRTSPRGLEASPRVSRTVAELSTRRRRPRASGAVAAALVLPLDLTFVSSSHWELLLEELRRVLSRTLPRNLKSLLSMREVICRP